jgi:hypothetical protein
MVALPTLTPSEQDELMSYIVSIVVAVVDAPGEVLARLTHIHRLQIAAAYWRGETGAGGQQAERPHTRDRRRRARR